MESGVGRLAALDTWVGYNPGLEAETLPFEESLLRSLRVLDPSLTLQWMQQASALHDEPDHREGEERGGDQQRHRHHHAVGYLDGIAACGWRCRAVPVRQPDGNAVGGLVFNILFGVLDHVAHRFQVVQRLDGSVVMKVVPAGMPVHGASPAARTSPARSSGSVAISFAAPGSVL